MIFEIINFLILLFFSLILLSYYLLLFFIPKKQKTVKKFNSITIIIPVHNEEMYVENCIKSVKLADFEGIKKIIIINDGSIDNSLKIINENVDKNDLVLNFNHQGKSKSINKALEKVDTDLFAIVDGDSEIPKNSLIILSKEVSKKNVAAATTVMKVKNTNRFICIWLHLEQLYNSLIREIQSKINANVTTPGPLSIYRTKEVIKLGGFSEQNFSEDMDITIRLIRSGKKINFSNKTYAYTNMPHKFKEFSRQRKRFCMGVINMFSKHLRINKLAIDIYTFPILLFGYMQAVIMGFFMLYNIILGYNQYFIQKGIFISYQSILFLINWLSIFGFINWVIRIFSGLEPLTIIAFFGIFSTFMTFPLFIIAIIKYDKKFNFKHLLAIMFMNTFWFIVMFYQIISFPEFFNRKRKNIWKKNEK
jgi:cellulose synthase/poly-beta-1,6-N-acetylglucosamine synthase-like glycosyltransferase